MWKSRKLRDRELRVAALARMPSPAGVLPTPADIAALQAQIEGTVVVPTDSGYDAARQVFSHEFQYFPQLIVYCEVFEDVRCALKFAQTHKLWAVARSGGHSTAGYSVESDMVIDLSRLNYVVVDAAAKRATIGAGTTFGQINATLDTYRLHMVGGACEDVAVAGYTQGGGYGFTSREFGMACDNLLEALVMLADGTIAVASAERNSDLFWAIRGGTGNNFGIVLQLTFRLHDLWKVWGFGLLWSIDDAPPALVEMQKDYMTSGAPDQLGYMVVVTAQQGKNVLLMRGLYHGSREDGLAALKPLMATKGCSLQIDMVDTYLAVNRYIVDEPYPIPDVPNGVNEDKQSGYVSRPLTLADWQALMRLYAKTPSPWSWFAIEPYGGQINRVAKGANAFIHRDVLMNCFFGLFWRTPEQRLPFEAFLDLFVKTMAPFCDGRSYQNYPRRQQKNYAAAYWGDYVSSLAAIKRKYDPANFFHFQQAVRPDEAGGAKVLVAPDGGPIVREPYASGES